jgi:hypothetical protein
MLPRVASVVLLIVGALATPPPLPSAAAPVGSEPAREPCDLLTRKDVKRIYGGPVARPEETINGDCEWQVDGGAFEGGIAVRADLSRGTAAETSFDEALTTAQNSGGFLFVTGVGKDQPRAAEDGCLADCAGAIFSASPAGTFQRLTVRLKDATYTVGVQLAQPPEGAVESPDTRILADDDPLASELDELEELARRARSRF